MKPPALGLLPDSRIASTYFPPRCDLLLIGQLGPWHPGQIFWACSKIFPSTQTEQTPGHFTIAKSGVQWIDVSPSNILINNKLEIKAIDFEIISDERGTTYYGLHPVLQEQAPTPRELVSLWRGSLSALIQN